MSIINIRAFLAGLLTVASLITLNSCGGGGGGGPVNVVSNPPAATTGSLAVRVFNVPAGVPVAVRITGPGGYARTVTQDETLSNLVAGEYRVAADTLVVGSATYLPVLLQSEVNLQSGATWPVEVFFVLDLTGSLTTREFVAGLEFPTFLTAPANDSRQFIVERPGRIRIVRDGALLATPFLDISARVFSGGEGGLLSMEFAPDYATSGVFYLYYTNLAQDIVVERYTVSSNPDRASTTGNYEIIRIPHPNFTNHFGGMVRFGSDGYLWLGTGDGGGAGDPPNNAQNRGVLLGKLLRLDVSQSSAATPYRIPPNNPFVSQAGVRPEIWAYGLRNPWRFDFYGDGIMVIPDVGQDRIEEINFIYESQAGLNFGWDIMEGSECFGGATCSKTGLEPPGLEYTHAATGGCSIIGGYVYNGKAFPELRGHFFFSDFCAGFLKSYSLEGPTPTRFTTWTAPGLTGVTSFGRDSEGELYLLSSSGTVWKIVRRPASAP